MPVGSENVFLSLGVKASMATGSRIPKATLRSIKIHVKQFKAEAPPLAMRAGLYCQQLPAAIDLQDGDGQSHRGASCCHSHELP